FENAGREGELTSLLREIAKLGQGAQDTPRRRTGQLGCHRGLRKREAGAFASEQGQHSEAFRQRGHEFLVRACARSGGGFARWRRGRAFCGAPSGHIALPDHTQTTLRPHSDHTQTTLALTGSAPPRKMPTERTEVR